jgi:hypothetical protein
MSGMRAISTTSRRELSSSPPSPPPQGKAPKEIHAILTETLSCFLPGRAKDLSALMYKFLILDIYYPAALYLREQGCDGPWLFAKPNGAREQSV